MNTAPSPSPGLIGLLLQLPIFQAEWVLYLLLLLSVISVAIIIERYWFMHKRRLDVHELRMALARHLAAGDVAAAASLMDQRDCLESNVVLSGLRHLDKGPESVEEIITGALGTERNRYEERLNFLATVASNAPYIGLFGTVLGIIRAFRDLSSNLSQASQSVMAGIGEALISTAVGLLVAIPAVMAFNYFRERIKNSVTNAQMLARVLLAELKAADKSGVDGTTDSLRR